MHETVDQLAAAGSKHVLVIPISFVSDHVETLHEIGIEHRKQAGSLGIAEFRLMPGLNDSPDFIRVLRNAALRAAQLSDSNASLGIK
jgi:ferrochelatase